MGYLAIDLGASSGRAIIGDIEGNKINTKEVYRFSNAPIEVNDNLYWDIDLLLNHIKKGIKEAFKVDQCITSLAIDSWGVDFGLLDKNGNLLQNPKCYRDNSTLGLIEDCDYLISKEEFYYSTGIQQMNINSVYQLKALQKNNPNLFNKINSILFIPDLLNFLLTGKTSYEYTIASTSQLLNAKDKKWDFSLFDKLNLPHSLVGQIDSPGTLLGQLKESIASELIVPPIAVYTIGSHDTASAIGAIPFIDKDKSAFLSSGTWSLFGVVSNDPILTDLALKNHFTNEGGVNDQILFMRNIAGLWILQQVIAEWEREENINLSYDMLLNLCDDVPPFKSIINTDHESFNYPQSMMKAIQNYCSLTSQVIPQTKGEIIRCILESLVLKYSIIFDRMKECLNKEINQLYIVGGGSLNIRLNQWIANALNVEVVIGVTESTAIGNIMQQAIATREVRDWKHAHQIISNTYFHKVYFPIKDDNWRRLKQQIVEYLI